MGIFPPSWGQVFAVAVGTLSVLPGVSSWTSAALSVDQVITGGADAVNSTPDKRSWAEAGLSLFVPMFFRWALNTVWSEQSCSANTVLTVPDSVLGAHTLVDGVVPESWGGTWEALRSISSIWAGTF